MGAFKMSKEKLSLIASKESSFGFPECTGECTINVCTHLTLSYTYDRFMEVHNIQEVK